MKTLELGPRQRATIAAAITLGSVMILVAFISIGLWGLGQFVSAFQNVILPPVVAGILTMLLRPYFSILVTFCRGSQALGLTLFFLSILIPLALFLSFISVTATNQLLRLFDDLPSLINSIVEAGQSFSPQVSVLLEKYGLMSEVDKLIDNPVEKVASFLQGAWDKMSQPIVLMFQSVVGLLAWASLPLYLAFFLMAKPFEANHLGEFLPFLKKDTREDVIYLFDNFIKILLTFFRGQIIIAFIQGILFAIGFSIVGFPYSIVIGMLMGLLNIVPYLGSIVGLSIVLPLAYFGNDGGLYSVMLVMLVFVVVQTIEGYFLTPKIMGNRTGLHPALIIFAIFFWGSALGGIMGMILAIPLTAFAVVFWKLLKLKYISEVV